MTWRSALRALVLVLAAFGFVRGATAQPPPDGDAEQIPAETSIDESIGAASEAPIVEDGAEPPSDTETGSPSAEPASGTPATTVPVGSSVPVVTASTTEPVPSEPAPPEPLPPGALTEAVGAMPFSESVGLRDIDVRGIGGRVGIAGVDTRGGALARVMLEAFGALLDDQIRLSLAMPMDFANPRVQSWERGSADLYATVGWLPLRRGPLSLLVDAGLWIPTQLDHGLPNARIVPSIEAAWLVSDTFHLRMRQAAMLDLDSRGARLWASAYGMDARVVGPVGVAFEVELVVGDPDNSQLRADYAFVPGVVIDLSWMALHIGGRFGINTPTFFGPAGLFVSARIAAF